MSISTRSNCCKWLITFILLLSFCGCGRTLQSVILPTPPTDKFSSGDIVLRLGRTLQSELIASSGDSLTHYSHIGIILFRGDSCCVVHIEPKEKREADEILCEPIERFFSSDVALSGCVMSYEALSPTQRDRIAIKTQELLDSRILFDHDYLLSDSTRMYCTELVENIYSEAGISLSEGRRRTLPLVREQLILPSDIAQNKNLRTLWHLSYDDLRPAR
ncbi:MAG: hypothetical protein IKM12_02485 [Alistipes sp.]|nr:hypothetical protein [Alistipes sp.]